MAQTQAAPGLLPATPPLPFRPDEHNNCDGETTTREEADALTRAGVEIPNAIDFMQWAMEDYLKATESVPSYSRIPQPENCYLLKTPTELLYEIVKLLPTSAQICLRHNSARLLQLCGQFQGWASRKHHRTYQSLVLYYSVEVKIRNNEELGAEESVYRDRGCSYCKAIHELSWFSADVLERPMWERKCRGADTTLTLRISPEVDMTWAEFNQYLGKEKHLVSKQTQGTPSSLYSWKWSHIIHVERTPEMQQSLTSR